MKKVLSVFRIIMPIAATTLAVSLAGTGRAQEKTQPCVVVWSEGTAPKNPYPADINSAIADGLKAALPGWNVVVANLKDPEQGLPEALLDRTDVLVWWGHKKHGEVKDELADRIVKRVQEKGMGFIALHSAHFAKPNIKLMSLKETSQELLAKVTPGHRVAAWGGYKDSVSLNLRIKTPSHPIAQGIPAEFSFANAERYDDPYAVPPAADVVFDGVFTLKDGTTTTSVQGLCWQIGKGRMFYFQPGHETSPIFFDPNIRKIMANAVQWAAPVRN